MKVEQKNIYRCSCCNDSFEDETECENHEKLCGKYIKVKTIWMPIDIVTGRPYFSVAILEWTMESYLDNEQSFDAVHCSESPDSYEVYTTDLSKETENKLKLELLNHRRAILESRIKRESESISYIDREIKKINRKINSNNNEKEKNEK